MKRYKLTSIQIPGVMPDGTDGLICVNGEMSECKEGEWVKLEDLCPLCRGVGVHDVDEFYKDSE